MHWNAALTYAGALCFTIWLYLWLGRGRFWQVDLALPPPVTFTGRVAIIIPARNEAESIAETVTSLLRQTCAGAAQVFVVDDESDDGTAEIARRAARVAGRPDALVVIRGRSLPGGWTGKLWALQQGIEAAASLNPDFLLFTDADITHSADSIATLAAIAEQGSYDLVSFIVKLRCQSLAEKLLIPAFVFFFFQLYPPRWASDRNKKTAGAAGGCVLIRPQALAAAGGLAAIRNEIIDDCALAGAVKQSGGRLWLGLTSTTHSTRRYETFRDLGQMISRTAFKQLRHSTLLLAGALLGLTVTYLWPIGLMMVRPLLPATLGAATWLLMALLYLPMIRFYKLRWSWALALPAGALFYMGATFHSAVKFWFHRGGEWKGRVQDPAGH